MKSQDVGLLLCLASLQRQEDGRQPHKAWPLDWRDWEENLATGDDIQESADAIESLQSRYTARALEKQTGISKTQLNLALNRCYDIGLARRDRKTGVPRANTRPLYDFIIHGLKYVFPTKPGELVRGIATSFAAPVLKGKLLSGGDYELVWPDAQGNTKGLKVDPLFKTATYAAKRNPDMYALLALIDAIRLGQPRENHLAGEMLKDLLLDNP